LNQAQQITSNLGIVTTEVNSAQTALQSAVSLVDSAQSLGTEGASDLASSDTQQNVADQLGTILQQLVAAANTTVGGRLDANQPHQLVSGLGCHPADTDFEWVSDCHFFERADHL
jgi:CHASE3 domain sensor protein